MKKSVLIAGVLVAMAAGAFADTSLTAYGTYWDGDDPGQGMGLRLKKTILAFMAVEGRGGYVDFSDTNTELIPLDVSINARLPFFISPYAGVGVGYYFVDSDLALDDFSGGFVQVGIEATFVWIGAMAEIRYYEMDEEYLDGSTSANIGLLLKW